MKILCIFAHPDDMELACGGTIARYVQEGFEVNGAILGHHRNLKSSIIKSKKILGLKEVKYYGIADNMFDSSVLKDICMIVEKIISKYKPYIVFTHYRNDLNIDHRITYNAVLTACRSMRSQVKEIYSFPVLSSTEYQYPQTFCPNVYFNIKETLGNKTRATSCYGTELLEFPNSRSIIGILTAASYFGMQVNLESAEPAELIRMVK